MSAFAQSDPICPSSGCPGDDDDKSKIMYPEFPADKTVEAAEVKAKENVQVQNEVNLKEGSRLQTKAEKAF